MSDPKAALRYIYFMRPIGGDGRIKIGCSYKPARRLIAISVHSPYELEIIGVGKGAIPDEHLLHDYFAADRLHREWFRSSPELLTVIEMMGRGLSASDALDAVSRRRAA
jgi:hypothetical protein